MWFICRCCRRAFEICSVLFMAAKDKILTDTRVSYPCFILILIFVSKVQKQSEETHIVASFMILVTRTANMSQFQQMTAQSVFFNFGFLLIYCIHRISFVSWPWLLTLLLFFLYIFQTLTKCLRLSAQRGSAGRDSAGSTTTSTVTAGWSCFE